jgi:hypothetical protein
MSKLMLGKKTLVIVEIIPEQSEQEMFDVVRRISDAMDEFEKADRPYRPPVLVVGGFNDDPRELWHIPRAIQTMKRACAAGFISILNTSVLLEAELLDSKAPRMATMGAFELWLIATDQFEFDAGQVEIDIALFQKFLDDVIPEENDRLRRRIARLRSRGGEA